MFRTYSALNRWSASTKSTISAIDFSYPSLHSSRSKWKCTFWKDHTRYIAHLIKISLPSPLLTSAETMIAQKCLHLFFLSFHPFLLPLSRQLTRLLLWNTQMPLLLFMKSATGPKSLPLRLSLHLHPSPLQFSYPVILNLRNEQQAPSRRYTGLLPWSSTDNFGRQWRGPSKL